MSTIKSSAENLTLNADGANNDIKFQSNGVEKASIDQDGNLVLSGTLTSLGIDDNANATAITIDSAENVGINVVPESGWSTKVMQLGRTSIGAGNDATGGLMNWNAYYDGNWKYKDSLEATQYAMNNAHTFKVAPSGSANGAITWTTGFEVLGTGKARAKNGLLFGTDTAAANALDDYEEGTWTPAITAGAVAYTSQIGRYTKIGNKVFIEAFIQISSITPASSYSIVTGLPFGSAGSHYPSLASKSSGFNWGGSATMITFQVVPNTTTISAAGSSNNNTFNDINANGLLANDWIQFSGSYTAA